MLRMTWNDLKRYVDDALAADGRDGSIDIEYVDVLPPSEFCHNKLNISVRNNKLIVYN